MIIRKIILSIFLLASIYHNLFCAGREFGSGFALTALYGNIYQPYYYGYGFYANRGFDRRYYSYNHHCNRGRHIRGRHYR